MSITDLGACSPLALLAAIAVQARADQSAQSVAVIQDGMAEYGLRFGLDEALWVSPSPRQIREALDELRDHGFVTYHTGGLYKLNAAPIFTTRLVEMVRAKESAPAAVASTSGVDIETKRATLQQLARIVHPEIAAVLDALLSEELGDSHHEAH